MTPADQILIVDTETSSLDPKDGQLLELGAVLWSVKHHTLIECRSWLFTARTNAAIAVNGISEGLLQTSGRTRAVIFDEDIERFRPANTVPIVAWGADFDRKWLPELAEHPWICAMDDLEWPRPSGSKALVAVALAHGVGVVDVHRALADCLTLARLFERAAELGADIPAMLTRGLRPKALYEVADKGFDEARNKLAKENGFRWNPDARAWQRRMAAEDVPKLPFRAVPYDEDDPECPYSPSGMKRNGQD